MHRGRKASLKRIDQDKHQHPASSLKTADTFYHFSAKMDFSSSRLVKKIGVLLVLVACFVVGHGAQQASDSPPRQRAQFLFGSGSRRLAVTYTESMSNDKFKLGKSAMNYYLTEGDNHFDKHLGKISHRKDLVRCNNFLPNSPEMESLIDCKPLSSFHPSEAGKKSQTDTYAKRSIIVLSLSSFLYPVQGKPEQLYHLYPFQQDFIEQSFRRILSENQLPQDLGFARQSTTSGYFVTLNISETDRCTASVFISVNQTEPVPERKDDYPQWFHEVDHLILELLTEGGLVAIQDLSCGDKTPASSFALEMDFSLILRKQFPFVSCRHTIKTKPRETIWKYSGNITQIKDDSSPEAFNTSIQIDSSSEALPLNFKLDQSFTNKDFNTGSESMTFMHPAVTAYVFGNWSSNSLIKTVALYFQENLEPWLGDPNKERGSEPTTMFIYRDNPEEEFVTLSLSVRRKTVQIYKDLFSVLMNDANKLSRRQEAPVKRVITIDNVRFEL